MGKAGLGVPQYGSKPREVPLGIPKPGARLLCCSRERGVLAIMGNWSDS